MQKPEADIGKHFSKVTDSYQQAVNSTNQVIYNNVKIELDRNLEGNVLDIGNGGIFNYDTIQLSQVTAVDLSFADNQPERGNIRFIAGDARNLDKIESGSIDCVVMQYLLHHIVGKTPAETKEFVLTSLRETHRVLKPGGKLLIAEINVRPFIEVIENILYRMTFSALRFLNRPMINFYSKNGIVSRLNLSGFHQIDIKEINMGKWCDPLSGLFPGIIKIPIFLFPARCYFFTAYR